MHKQELVQKFNIGDIVQVVKSTEEFERSYEQSQQRILEDIKSQLQACLELDTRLLNDIKDYAAISEEKAFMLGVCEGIRLMKAVGSR